MEFHSFGSLFSCPTATLVFCFILTARNRQRLTAGVIDKWKVSFTLGSNSKMSEYCEDNLFPQLVERDIFSYPFVHQVILAGERKSHFILVFLWKQLLLLLQSSLYLLITVMHKLLDDLRKKPWSLCKVFVCRGGRLTKRLNAKYQNVSRKFLLLLCYSLNVTVSCAALWSRRNIHPLQTTKTEDPYEKKSILAKLNTSLYGRDSSE